MEKRRGMSLSGEADERSEGAKPAERFGRGAVAASGGSRGTMRNRINCRRLAFVKSTGRHDLHPHTIGVSYTTFQTMHSRANLNVIHASPAQA